ncbi:MAG: hypothetical protein U9P82_11800 [Bacteroidota bacterium]|nr:hypothetical protein [Bacteroidota bacterium]
MMKPEKFIGIILLATLLSCRTKQKTEQKIGEVIFDSNQYILNSTFAVDVYINGTKIDPRPKHTFENHQKAIALENYRKKMEVGVHDYEVKIYSFNGEPGKSITGKFIVKENQTSEVFIDFKEYSSWF